MFRLAHLSDVHLAPLPAVTWRQLASKRMTGYVNWQRGRGKSMGRAVLDTLTDDLLAGAPDHVAVTGDLTNLGLPAEILAARDWLASLGDVHRVSVIPGNHDAYVRGSLERATEAWSDFMGGERIEGRPYPFLRRIGPLAVIGCSSAEATPPFLAAGPFRARQAARLRVLLLRAGREGLFRVVMIHHPPVRGAIRTGKRMLGISHFQRSIGAGGAELVLHGHTHLPTQMAIDAPFGSVPVIGVAAGGQAPGGHRPAARYNLFEIDGEPGAWRVTQIERGLERQGAVAEIARRTLIIPDARMSAGAPAIGGD